MIVLDPAPSPPLVLRRNGRPRVLRTWHLSDEASPLKAFQPRGVPGRWNHAGVPLVYTAESPAAAVLELVAAWGQSTELPGYQLFSCTFEPQVVEVAPLELALDDLEATRSFGSAWARSQRSVVLRVPSAALEGGFSFLINPWHPASAKSVWLARQERPKLSLRAPAPALEEPPR